MNATGAPLPLSPGLRHSERQTVTPRQTVPAVEPDWPGFRDMPAVFATAMMIGFIEQTCVQALRGHLSAGQHTVGTQIAVSHVAATPVGMTVTATVELIAVEGRSLLFAVSCRDDMGLIGEGTHRRAIVDLPRFLARLEQKARPSRTT